MRLTYITDGATATVSSQVFGEMGQHEWIPLLYSEDRCHTLLSPPCMSQHENHAVRTGDTGATGSEISVGEI